MEKFRAVLDLHLKHHSALGFCLVTLLTAGGERIFSAVVFQCPCSAAWNQPYGLVFLLVPALALFLLGYVLSARTWRLLTGCCARSAGTGCGAGLRAALVCAQLSAAAAVAPLTWVAVALLGGAFYECAASGSAFVAQHLCVGRDSSCAVQLPLVPCGQAQAPDVQNLQKELKAQSQVLGWVLIAAVILVLLIFVSITRCLSPISFLQLKFWKIYLEQEKQILKSQATEHATQLAKENIKCFFECSHPKEYHTPSIKDWHQISSLYTFNPKEQYYSILHKYVNRKDRNQSIKSSEGDAVVPVLGFVDSADMNSISDL
ncbi:calcium homeostasis modulator protein 6 [Hippopotamus amphibius kiboko]|uniref:calcium homeostasis modulator protein 6 n=1 Tax=Hippopotamus amphibius kiboko TaxID=575201 RepID=UPI002598C56C|nr:calcium homeostasis modulator protein 6 [Hippopotamus amphibius kiboko]XP_057595737.1 calcium homeostasis modulator protein 6 [Hippopotamus amphibius kiboko]